MKITPKGLEANWEEIETLSQAYDRGCKSEEAYKAKLFNMIYEMAYIQGVEDTHNTYFNNFLLSNTMGNA
jgi:hypothetical protein